MKTVSAIFTAFLVAAGPSAWPQCTPNASNTALITPDTITNFVSGVVGQPYTQVVYLHPPDDTTTNVPPFGMITVNITNITLDAVDNLPPGLAYACNPGTCIYPGGVSGCALISGTPTMAGTFVLDIAITSNGTVTIIGNTIPVSQQDTIQSYRIIIDPPATGIAAAGASPADAILYVRDAPAGIEATVHLATAQDVRLSVGDLAGRTLYSERLAVPSGTHPVLLAAPAPAPGIYVLTVRTASGLLTRKFAVTGAR